MMNEKNKAEEKPEQDPFDEEFEEGSEQDQADDLDSTSPGDETAGEGTKQSEGEKAPRWRDDIYRRQSKLEKTLTTENQKLQQTVSKQMNQMQGMLQGFLANQQKGAGGAQQEQDADPGLDPETEKQYWDQKPGEIARYLIQKEMTKERKRLRSELRDDVLGDVRQETTTATTMRRIYHDFPELRNEFHPFSVKASEIYNELVEEFGGAASIPEGSGQQLSLVQTAAERAARLHDGLRDAEDQSRRRGKSTVETQRATGGGMTIGRPGNRKKKSSQGFTAEDESISKAWKVNLKDPKVAARIQKSKEDYAEMRLTPKYSEEEE